MSMNEHMLKPILVSEKISHRVRQLGKSISDDYRDLNPVLIGVLNGSFIFLGDLVRYLKIIHEVDFIKISSYTNGSTNSEITLINDISMNITGREILIIEDIVDTGNSLQFLKQHLSKYDPKNIRVCTLIDKKERRKVKVEIDYKGFDVDYGFLIGYGMDYNGWGRNLSDIHVLNTKGGNK